MKADIVQAAAEIIEETGGRESVTLRGIARKAGITAPSIYAHFSTVEEILRAVVVETLGEMVKYVAEHVAGQQSPRERLAAACAAYVRFGLGHPHQYRLLFARDEGGVGAQVSMPPQPLETEHGAAAFSLLRETAAGHIRAIGSTADDPELDEAAIALWVGLHGYVGLRLAMPTFPLPPEDRMIGILIQRLARLE